jgi:DNA mismatch endonuclease (patch repair protein)
VRPLRELRCHADVVFPRERVAVFVDGCFWHGCPKHGNVPKDRDGYWAAKLKRNVERDRRNDEALQAAGWAVLRYWEHQDSIQVAETVRSEVIKRRLG